MKTKATKLKQSKIRQCMKAPIRALSKLRDFYIKSMNNLAGEATFGGGLLASGHAYTTLPKSFSVNASSSSRSEEDFRELLRVASSRSSFSSNMESEFRRRGGGGALEIVPRSQSVGIGRIEEDRICEFGNEEDYGIRFKTTTRRGNMFRRTKSLYMK